MKNVVCGLINTLLHRGNGGKKIIEREEGYLAQTIQLERITNPYGVGLFDRLPNIEQAFKA
jgi:hypothetical protein